MLHIFKINNERSLINFNCNKRKGGKIIKKKLILVSLIALFVIFLILTQQKITAKETIQEIKTIESVETLKNGYVYFGRPTCPYCEIFYPWLKESSEKNDIDILYLNTDEVNDQDLDELSKIYDIEHVPYLIKISDGKKSNVFESFDSKDKEKTIKNLNEFFTKKNGE